MDTPLLPASSFYQHVYEPAEDTFLLMDAIEQDLTRIREIRPLICLEVGCGSGAVLLAVRQSLGNGTWCIGTDVNHHVVDAVNQCADMNNLSGCTDIILTDVAAAIDDRLKNSIDLLIFNPPYVPTEDHESEDRGICASWSGGSDDGTAVIRRFIHKIPDLLSSTGIFYLLLLQENHPDKMIQLMNSLGLDAGISITRRCGRENLSVVSGTRRQ